jgi:hypothetical protein
MLNETTNGGSTESASSTVFLKQRVHWWVAIIDDVWSGLDSSSTPGLMGSALKLATPVVKLAATARATTARETVLNVRDKSLGCRSMFARHDRRPEFCNPPTGQSQESPRNQNACVFLSQALWCSFPALNYFICNRRVLYVNIVHIMLIGSVGGFASACPPAGHSKQVVVVATVTSSYHGNKGPFLHSVQRPICWFYLVWLGSLCK